MQQQHPGLQYLDRMLQARKSQRHRHSLSQDFTNILQNEKSVLENRLFREARLKNRMATLSQSQTNRIDQLQAKLNSQFERNSKNREQQLNKTVKKCKVHAKFVKSKLDKHFKTVRQNMLQASKNIQDFNMTMENYWQTKRKTSSEKQKESYWKFMCRLHQSTEPNETVQNEEEVEDIVPLYEKTSSNFKSTRKPIVEEMPKKTSVVSCLTYEQKCQEVKSRAEELREKRQKEVFQKYGNKMEMIENIKTRRGRQNSKSDDQQSEESDRGGYFITQGIKEESSPKRKVFVRSLLKPIRYMSTELKRVKDHSQENVRNREHLHQQMHTEHNLYLQNYMARLEHVRAVRNLKEQLHQKKLYFAHRC